MESIKKKLAIEGQEQALTPEENRIYYGAYDVYEFVEMMMTQPEFQQEMAKIKTGNGKSVLDLFKNFLNTLFKNLGIQLETGTIASEAIENILILVDEKGRLKQPTQAIVTQEVSKSDLEKLKQTPEGKKIEKERQEELKPYLITSIDDKINIINENLGKMGFAGLANSPSIIFAFNEREPSTSFLQKPITKEGGNYRIITSRYNVLVDKDFNIISTTNVDTGKTYKYKESEIGNSIVEIGRVPDNFKVSQLIEQLFNENTAYKQNKQEEINKKYDEELKKLKITTQPSTTSLTKEEADWLYDNIRLISETYNRSTLADAVEPTLINPIQINELTTVTAIEPRAGDESYIWFERPTGKWAIHITDRKGNKHVRLLKEGKDGSYYTASLSAEKETQLIKEAGLENLINNIWNDTNVSQPATRVESFNLQNSLQQKYGLKRTFKDIVNELMYNKPSTSEKSFTTKVDQFTYTYNPVTKQVIHNAKAGDKVETNETQINKVLAAYAKTNNFETKVFNKQEYVQIDNKVLNVNTGSRVTQKEILDLFAPTVSNSIKEFMELYFESQIDKAKLEQAPIPLSEEFKSRLTERIIAFDKQNLDVPIVRLGINFDNEFSDLANLPNNIQNSLKKELAKIITPIEKENKVKNKDFYYTRISQRLLGAGVQEKISSLKYDKDYLSKLIDIIITTKNLSESEISRQLKLSNDATHRLLIKASQLGIVSKTEPFKLLITSFEQLKNKFKSEGFVIQESTVSNSIKNDLLNILEDIKRETDDESLNDNLKFPVVNASEFSGYPNIQKYLNTEYGIEQREYEFFKSHKDVVEDLLSSMKEINPTNLLEKLKSVTDTNDTGVDSNIKPIITSDTKKEEALLKQANKAIKNTKYELFPDVYANEEQTEALDKLTDFLNSPRDKSEKTQSTFVLVGRGGTGKTTIVKKIVDEFPGSKVVGAAVSHTAKNNLKKSLSSKTVKTISAVTGIGNGNKIRDKFNDNTLAGADIIIVDECSMIDTFTMNRIYQLANPNAKIIFMGDNVQLPPINEKSSPTFDAATKPEYNAKLTKRMRQGEDSPIVPLSDIVAENIERPEKEIERKVIKRRDSNFNPITNKGVIFTDSKTELMENLKRDFKADVQNTKVITYTNDEGSGNRTEMNGVVRDILWGADAKNEYNVGEILVADNIIYDANILNGEYYQVQSVKPTDNAVTIGVPEIVPGRGIVTNQKKFPGYAVTVKVISETDNFGKTITLNLPSAASKKEINRIQDDVKTSNPSLHYQNTQVIPDVNYGYAITSHKAQGSTFNNTYVMEDNIVGSRMSNKETNQSLYVAMTRPRNKLVMFSELKEGEFLTEKQKENMVPTGESLQPEEITSVEEKTQKNTVSSAIENQIEELIRKGIIKSKCD
jgi:exodeoxyribonuclease-5